MQVKRLQQYQSIASGNIVKVTTVGESRTLCVIKDVVDGKIVPHSGRAVQVDSLRRKYNLVA
jgi:hypothetical protein